MDTVELLQEKLDNRAERRLINDVRDLVEHIKQSPIYRELSKIKLDELRDINVNDFGDFLSWRMEHIIIEKSLNRYKEEEVKMFMSDVEETKRKLEELYNQNNG